MFQILNISKLQTGVFYEAFKYIGEALMPICLFFAIMYFINNNFKFQKKHLTLFIIPIGIILFTFTNSWNHLVFKNFSTNFKERVYGPLFYVYIVNIYITYLLNIVSLFGYLSKNSKQYFRQIIMCVIGFAIPYLFQFVATFQVFNIKTYINEVLQSISSIFIILILLKYQFLTQIPLSLKSILNIISDAFIVIDKKGTIVLYNEVFLNVFDLGKLNIKGMLLKELIEYKEFDTFFTEDIDKLVNLSNDSESIYFERTSDVLGLTLKYEMSVLEDHYQKLYVISIADITQYTRDIQNIKLNHDAIVGKERLASLGQMIGGIAHNLKTPIFSMAGAMEGLEELVAEYRESITDETVTVDDHKDIAKDMRVWTDKISGYLSYMTDIITAIQMQTAGNSNNSSDCFSIKELIKYINILMKYELKQNLIDLRINTEIDESRMIFGNINSLIQVLNNLISNAIQAYPQNAENKVIELNIYQKDKKIYLDIKDYAGGIPDEVANKLFKEMITTKGKNGTGLGLFISYTNIKTQFGGNLTFSTKSGIGTTFRIMIPDKS
jgi:signal transduction histidine kinase